MRYLKSYKLFESISADIKADIEDMLLELTDYQIEYSVTELKYYKDVIKGEDCLRVYIKDNQNRFFELKDIMDVLLRIKDYLKESDYSIDIGIPNSDDYLDIDNFMKEFSGEELYNINIYIYYNPRVSFFKRRYTVDKDTFESKKEVSDLKFTLQPKKKGAKTDTYNVSKDGQVIGQIKWYSRMRGYGFLPTPDCNDEIKEFIKDLMKKRKEEKKNEVYKIFESSIDDLENYTHDILRELEDIGLQVETSRKFFNKLRSGICLEVYINRPRGVENREIPGVSNPQGGYSGNLFFWYEIKETIIRLTEWYYSQTPYDPIDKKTIWRTDKDNSPLMFFASGIEMFIGFNKEEDFSGIGDYISFTSFRLVIRS